MERFLYFRTEATDASDDARTNSACYPASSLVSMQPTGDTILALDFLVDGESSTVLLNLTAANTHITAIQAITHSITTGKSFTNKRYLPALIIVANDDSGGTEYLEGSGIASCGTIKHASSVLYYNKITNSTQVNIIPIDTKTQALTSMTLANIHSGDASVTVFISNPTDNWYIIKDVVIPTGMTLKLEKDELDYDGDIFNLYVKLGGSTPVDVIVR
tara:strand:+ start:12 stop:662 length:651 start_codon:yes stop_codon:yes gene_type:complete